MKRDSLLPLEAEKLIDDYKSVIDDLIAFDDLKDDDLMQQLNIGNSNISV